MIIFGPDTVQRDHREDAKECGRGYSLLYSSFVASSCLGAFAVKRVR